MRRGVARAIIAFVVLGSSAAAFTQLAGGCQATPVQVPVRSLEQSGKVSFVCLAPPGSDKIELDISACTAQQFTSTCEYFYQDDAGDIDAGAYSLGDGGVAVTYLPHLYALVTQPLRGEVAVVDYSAATNSVLDENYAEPGANFLPVGGNPTGIVSTPGSKATFVGVSEIGRAGIFAIPSAAIRPPASNAAAPDDPCQPDSSMLPAPPQLHSWPACYLPGAPADMILVSDPAAPDGTVRRSCPGAGIDPDDEDYTKDATFDPITAEKNGRQKLVVAIPSLGGIAVIDADRLLERDPGSFDACTVERWLPLDPTAPNLRPTPTPPTGLACANPAPTQPPPAASYKANPGGLSWADGKLYVADRNVPVIHVVDMDTPCNPIERTPLLPSSAEDPARIVKTERVSIAPTATPDLKRYLYATDTWDGSAMVFDVGPGSTSRHPLIRKNAEWNPLEPRDRVKFSAPISDLVVVEHDQAEIDPVTGIATTGVRCDPDPSLLICVKSSTSCDVSTQYRTSADYTTGAGPLKLRGDFAFAALSDGKVAVIDIDDFDAPCRKPTTFSPAEGCGTTQAGGLITSAELSCNVVSPNQPRAANFEALNDAAGNHVPGIQAFPLLYKQDGTLFSDGPTPRMLATLPDQATINACIASSCTACPYQIYAGGQQTPIDLEAGLCSTPCLSDGTSCNGDTECCGSGTGGNSRCVPGVGICRPRTCTAAGDACTPAVANDPSCSDALCDSSMRWTTPSPRPFERGGVASNNALVMNFEDPRAQALDQNWTVTFEGPLPGFDQRQGGLTVTSETTGTFIDSNSRYCDFGVLGKQAFTELLDAQQPKKTALMDKDLADYVQITVNLPDQTDPYWLTGPACNYAQCFAEFGSIDTPLFGRDLRITEAYQDRLEVETRDTGVSMDEIKCCFPTALTFNVRAGNQWVVVGDQSQFLHHVVPDGTPSPSGATSGRCRNSCDPLLARKNGRLVESTAAVPDRLPSDLDPSPAFINPMFRFSIRSSGTPTPRDAVFRFSTTGSFVPLLIGLTTDPTALVLPQGIIYVPSTGELAITDGSQNGLIMVSLQTATISRQFF